MLRRVILLALLGVLAAAGTASARTDRNQALVRVVVAFRPHVPRADRDRLTAGTRLAAGIPQLRVRVVDVHPANVAPLLARLHSSRAVAYAQRDGGGRIALTPDDPYYAAAAWVFGNTRLADTWNVTTGAPTTIVAVLDTGVDPGTADLAGALLPGWDFVNGDADPADDHGHGTSVAATIGARLGNGVGISGVCGRCSILPVKVADSGGHASWSSIAAGLTWATDHGARVINISIAGPAGGSVLEQGVDYAVAHGVVVVAGAGNDGLAYPEYPAAYAGVVSVAASTSSDELYGFSNHGPGVLLAAPGCVATVRPGNVYANACGTSFSSPVVAGAAGLLRSYRPGASGATVAAALESSGDRVGGIDSRYGRLNAYRALQAIAGAPAGASPSAAVPLPVATPPAPAAVPPRLTLAVEAPSATTSVGGEVQYALTIANGGGSAENVSVAVGFPAVGDLRALASDGALACSSGAPLVCSSRVLAAGASARATIALRPAFAGTFAGTATLRMGAGGEVASVPLHAVATPRATSACRGRHVRGRCR